jgi:hypothetical protein
MVKKFLASVLVVLAIVFFGGIATATPALAAKSHSITSSTGVAKAVPTFVTSSVTPVTSVPSAPMVNGGVKPAWLYVSCYLAMNGERWCWRYGCTFFETVAMGCYTGWYRTYSPWYA